MFKTLLLKNGDFDFNATLSNSMSNNNNAIVQTIICRLRELKNDFVFNQNAGSDYIIKKENNLLESLSYDFKSIIIKSPGVLSLTAFSLTTVKDTMHISFSILSDNLTSEQINLSL